MEERTALIAQRKLAREERKMKKEQEHLVHALSPITCTIRCIFIYSNNYAINVYLFIATIRSQRGTEEKRRERSKSY